MVKVWNLKDELEAFASTVGVYQYERMPYDKWRKLKKWENELVLCYHYTDETIGFRKTLPSEDGEEITFDCKDNSFGQWFTKSRFRGKGTDIKKEKEGNNMKIIDNSKFNFGSCERDNIKMSAYGLAIKNAEGVYVSYDAAAGKIMDVDIFNFDGGKFLYKMPVAIKDIKAGDVVIHNRVPMFVKAVGEDKKLAVIDPYAGEEKLIMLAESPFGFSFATKVVSLFNFDTTAAAPENPFGNMLPFLCMGDGDIDPMAMCLMMNQGGDLMKNPMAMYLMLKDNKGDKDMLPFLFMMNNK